MRTEASYRGENIMEPAIKHGQSEKKGTTTLQLAEPPYSVNNGPIY